MKKVRFREDVMTGTSSTRRPPQAQHGNANSSGTMRPRASVSIFLVLAFLVCVRISVNNIQNAFKLMPDTNTYVGHANYLDKIASDGRAKELQHFGEEASTIRIISSVRNEQKLILNGNEVQMKKHLHNSGPNTTSSGITTSDPLENSNASLSPPVSDLSALLSVTPNANNTAISLVSMGRFVDTFLVERCILSIRRRGLFSGYVIVFTDDVGYKRYQQTLLPWDNRTLIVQGHQEDMDPREEPSKDGTRSNQNEPKRIKYAQRTMVFKRFKTHHSKYIKEYPDLSNSIRYVLYADVDNIFGSPMDIFFEDYTTLVTEEYQKAANVHLNITLNATESPEESAADRNNSSLYGFGFVSMFRDKHLRSKMHGGIVMYDRIFEEQCVNGWRNEMDTFWDYSDQTMFLRVLDDYNRYRCTVFDFPSHHMSFATKAIMTDAMEERQGRRPKRKKPLKFPTFIHVTKSRVKNLNNTTIHDEFVRHLLKLKANETIKEFKLI